MTPAPDVPAHHGQGNPVWRLQHTCDPTNAGSEQEVRWGGVASKTHRRVTERCEGRIMKRPNNLSEGRSVVLLPVSLTPSAGIWYLS